MFLNSFFNNFNYTNLANYLTLFDNKFRVTMLWIKCGNIKKKSALIKRFFVLQELIYGFYVDFEFKKTFMILMVLI
ncbi:hypothetical protein BTO14_16685 [Polaribacter butkevichii]|uniref:Uncharacterized protein n=1 Tax=Polaribacter butkevichii TaxID=218490 RepID=A0A2P6C9N3_9FLAO|nr:hypothetical protein BTO14_16685 [Polaribacter butkevichii]